jgi:hypothetical protein
MRNMFLVLLILLVGCQEYEPKFQYLSAIIDLSEQGSYRPSSKEILSYLENGHPSDGLELSLSYVSETRYADKHQFVLPKGATGLLSNEDSRRTKRRLLLSQFKDTLGNIQKNFKALTHSEIFRLVTNQLSRLSKMTGSKTLLLFSDLKEHSSLYSVYNKRQLQILLKSPELVAKKFCEQVQLNQDLSGITIHVLYQPKLEDDQVFTALVALYRVVFEAKGAVIKVSKTHKFSFQR